MYEMLDVGNWEMYLKNVCVCIYIIDLYFFYRDKVYIWIFYYCKIYLRFFLIGKEESTCFFEYKD